MKELPMVGLSEAARRTTVRARWDESRGSDIKWFESILTTKS